jgi:hypothetical protein
MSLSVLGLFPALSLTLSNSFLRFQRSLFDYAFPPLLLQNFSITKHVHA